MSRNPITDTEAKTLIADFIARHTANNPLVTRTYSAGFGDFSVHFEVAFGTEADVYVERPLFAKVGDRIVYKVSVNYPTAGARSASEMNSVVAVLTAAAQLASLLETFISRSCDNIVADPKEEV